MQERIESIRNQPKDIAEVQVRNISSEIWEELYSKGRFDEAAAQFKTLFGIASERQLNTELRVEILANRVWSEYYIAQAARGRGGIPSKDCYVLGKQGIELSQNPLTRSRLFEVAGLSQAYLFDEQDEPAEQLFRKSVEEAEKSQVKTRIGEANNGLGLWLISPKQRKFSDAIPVFQEVARIQKEEANKRREGHAHNNLVVCYNATEQFEKALEEADKALELYEDPNLNHSFSARFRKSLALRGLGRQRKDRSFFERALGIYEENIRLRASDANLSEQEKARLIANENTNIAATREEMNSSD